MKETQNYSALAGHDANHWRHRVSTAALAAPADFLTLYEDFIDGMAGGRADHTNNEAIKYLNLPPVEWRKVNSVAETADGVSGFIKRGGAKDPTKATSMEQALMAITLPSSLLKKIPDSTRHKIAKNWAKHLYKMKKRLVDALLKDEDSFAKKTDKELKATARAEGHPIESTREDAKKLTKKVKRVEALQDKAEAEALKGAKATVVRVKRKKVTDRK